MSLSPDSLTTPKSAAMLSRYAPVALFGLMPFAFCAFTPQMSTNRNVIASMSLPIGVSAVVSMSAPKMVLNSFSTFVLMSEVAGMTIPFFVA